MNAPSQEHTPQHAPRHAARQERGRAGRRLFLQDFLRRPREVGSIIPSSRFLERSVVRSAALGEARTVVELGPGTGGTTRAFLRAMGDPRATLLVIEINSRFADWIRGVTDDPRLRVHAGDAGELRSILAEHGLPAPDVVLSGIPFSTMTRPQGRRIVEAIREALAPGGRFVAYQVRDRVGELGREVFGPERSSRREHRNLPPMRVWRWDKPAEG